MAFLSFSVRRRLRGLVWVALAAFVVYLNFFSNLLTSGEHSGRHAVVERPFRATEENQLSVARGDIVKLVSTKDSKWYFVEIRGKSGYIPASYILPMRPAGAAGKVSKNAEPVKAKASEKVTEYEPPEAKYEKPATHAEAVAKTQTYLRASPRQSQINLLGTAASVDAAWQRVQDMHKAKPMTAAENRSAAFVIINHFFPKNKVNFKQASADMSPPAGNAKWPKVTIITPTCVLRRMWHHNLYAMFNSQDYPGEIELLVGDGKCHKGNCGGKKDTNKDAEPDSAFAEITKKDKRVKYFFVDNPKGKVVTPLGRKRNFLVKKGTGDIVLHFDDDDFYSSEYVRVMVRHLVEKKLFFLKYSHWITYGETFGNDPDGKFQRLPTVEWERQDGLGWGWSYVYDREYALKHQFSDDKDESEEKGFVTAFKNGELPEKYQIIPDNYAIALRIVSWSCIRFTGNTNSKECMGRDKCTVLPDWFPMMLWGQEVAPYLKMWGATGLKGGVYGR